MSLYEMDWLWRFHTMSWALAKAPLLREEANLMLLGEEIGAMIDENETDPAKLARYEEEQELTTAAIKRQACSCAGGSGGKPACRYLPCRFRLVRSPHADKSVACSLPSWVGTRILTPRVHGACPTTQQPRAADALGFILCPVYCSNWLTSDGCRS